MKTSKKAKKAAAQDRVQTLKTGGGKYSPTMDEIDIKVVNMLGNRATPLVNQYDCSAEYLSQCELRHSLHFLSVSQCIFVGEHTVKYVKSSIYLNFLDIIVFVPVVHYHFVNLPKK